MILHTLYPRKSTENCCRYVYRCFFLEGKGASEKKTATNNHRYRIIQEKDDEGKLLGRVASEEKENLLYLITHVYRYTDKYEDHSSISRALSNPVVEEKNPEMIKYNEIPKHDGKVY
jgi:hypothetical protein